MKPKVLLIPDVFPWILGTWAKEITRHHSDKYHFLFISYEYARNNQEELTSLVDHCDIVHALIPPVKNSIIPYENPKVIPSIYHVIDWDNDFHLPTTISSMMTISKEWKSYMTSRGIDEDSIKIIHNGINSDVFKPLHKKEIANYRERLTANKDMFLIGFFGKYTSNTSDRKGIKTLLEFVSLTTTKTFKADYRIVLTGPGWSEYLEANTQLAKKTIYRPYLNEKDLVKTYNAIDAYLITSNTEGGPATLLEAMACGTAVITTPVGMAIDLVRNKENGLIINKNSPNEIISAIKYLQKHNNRKEEMITCALKEIIEKYTWEKTLAKIPTLYDRALSQTNFKCTEKKVAINYKKQRKKALEDDYKIWIKGLYDANHLEEAIDYGRSNDLYIYTMYTIFIYKLKKSNCYTTSYNLLRRSTNIFTYYIKRLTKY